MFRSKGDWSLDRVTPLDGTPLLAHVDSLLSVYGRGPLPNEGEPLPDAPARDPARIGFTAGATDGIFGGPGRGNEPLVAAAAVLHALRGSPSQRKTRAALERLAL